MDAHRTRAGRILAAAALVTTLTACGGSGDDAGGRFATGTGEYPLSCLDHQPDAPGAAYTGTGASDTGAIFQMLKYYTGNKAVTAYCDGKGPTDTDREWAELYVDLGAEPGNVSHLLRENS